MLTILPVRAAVPAHGRPDLWATLMSPRDLRVHNISNPVGDTTVSSKAVSVWDPRCGQSGLEVLRVPNAAPTA